jgi:hypothetical protein
MWGPLELQNKAKAGFYKRYREQKTEKAPSSLQHSNILKMFENNEYTNTQPNNRVLWVIGPSKN